MKARNLDSQDGVAQRTQEFIEALKTTPAVRRFVEAVRRFQSDQEVQELMGTLRHFQEAQQGGGMPAADVQRVRDAQTRMRNHRVVQEFFAARDGVGTFLQVTNQAISEILGLDFGQTAGPAGGTC